ncbi:hypothetical protein [Mycoavidus sp. B2-EB]|uniref:DUF7822 domain-containing protein n=1 Tax=Mycoavidus sp. B2-EB TaxID=2651972 RepID=UPI001624B3C9|nr:hypothetical protein [Mycoavidus sp. B2-EB]BBO59597.1 hypothetical protein MPB2EB_0718 [Mycoavidus sp. B2-EB]
MANRSYLYSTNVVPGPDVKKETRTFTGISEWNYDIPIIYKLLLSGNPRPCKSSIWDMPDDIALIGDYALGVERLKEFLNKITLPTARPLVEETLQFLASKHSINKYFVLECGEIFDMDDEPIQEQNAQLLDEIRNLDVEVERALASLEPQPVEKPKPVGWLAKLFGVKSPPAVESHDDPLQPVYNLGLGNWSNILYFDFSKP